MLRQIVLDTETTGLETQQKHRIIEIGCVEQIDRRLTGNNFHQYLQPDREIDEAAQEVHGITLEDLEDKPRFGDIVQDFIDYIRGAELIIHNAPFDVAFIDYELSRLDRDWGKLSDYCKITDSLRLAKKMHPGQRNSLEALCKRYHVEDSHRELHGALLDAELLADVYRAMTGGQTVLSLDGSAFGESDDPDSAIRRLPSDRSPLPVVLAQKEELGLHEQRLDAIGQGDVEVLWRREPSGAE